MLVVKYVQLYSLNISLNTSALEHLKTSAQNQLLDCVNIAHFAVILVHLSMETVICWWNNGVLWNKIKTWTFFGIPIFFWFLLWESRTTFRLNSYGTMKGNNWIQNVKKSFLPLLIPNMSIPHCCWWDMRGKFPTLDHFLCSVRGPLT